MGIQFKSGSITQTRWYEYLLRFLFGGVITVLTGFIAAKYGPVIGGLFLAVPSIFPASITLVQQHKQEKEEQKGESEEQSKESGEEAAGKTASGAVFGSIGLFAFALVIWQLGTRLAPWQVLLLAFLAWLGASVLAWWVFSSRAR